jgi:hypothetical protein
MRADMDDERRSAMCAWARENGLDPGKIDEWIEVAGGRIHYRELVGTRDGQPVWEERTAPLSVEFPVDEYRLSTRRPVVGGDS